MVLEFLADGFEEIEALTPLDTLRRAGVTVKSVAIGKSCGEAVIGAHGIGVLADISEDEAALIDKNEIEMIILPGGMPGAKNLDESEFVDGFVGWAAENGRYIASICAAPMIPGRRGLLSGKRAVCYPGFEEFLLGANVTGEKVETDGKYVTACGMGAALEFSLELTKLLKGEVVSEHIRSAILAK